MATGGVFPSPITMTLPSGVLPIMTILSAPATRGDSLIDLMTWLYVNKDFIMEQANGVLTDAENKRVAAINADKECEQHTLDLLKGVI